MHRQVIKQNSQTSEYSSGTQTLLDEADTLLHSQPNREQEIINENQKSEQYPQITQDLKHGHRL